MNPICFEVPGPPKAWKNHKPRVKAFGKDHYHIHSEDPSEQDKADFLTLAMGHRPPEPIQGPVLLAVIFWMPIPMATAQYKQKLYRNLEAGLTSIGAGALDVAEVMIGLMRRGDGSAIHTKRPDRSNLVKMVEDAMNGVFWQDDSQVQGVGFKLYSARPADTGGDTVVIYEVQWRMG